MTSEKISCPFCGGEMRVTEFVLTSMPAQSESTARCSDCHASLTVPGSVRAALSILDDKLMPDGMEWPRWQDGEKVRIGDTFTTEDGKGAREVSEVNVHMRTSALSGRGERFRFDDCTRVLPDTQDRIDEDAVKLPCDYWGQGEETSCTKCPRDDGPYGCFAAKILDLLRRQRELCKREAAK